VEFFSGAGGPSPAISRRNIAGEGTGAGVLYDWKLSAQVSGVTATLLAPRSDSGRPLYGFTSVPPAGVSGLNPDVLELELPALRHLHLDRQIPPRPGLDALDVPTLPCR